MKIYLAGPITGNPNYKEAFHDAEQHLTKLGHVVLNPAHLPEGLGDCDVYMRLCLPMVEVADAVILLDGWQDSRGACREWGYAMALDKIVLDYETFRKDEVLGMAEYIERARAAEYFEKSKKTTWYKDDVVAMLSGNVIPTADVVEANWISVEERLPTDEKSVLAYYGFDRGDGDLGQRFVGVLAYFTYDPNPHFQHESAGLRVTHWMPLPPPPRKESDYDR